MYGYDYVMTGGVLCVVLTVSRQVMYYVRMTTVSRQAMYYVWL